MISQSVTDVFHNIDLQFITSDIKPQPDSDNDDTPLPSLGHGELFEMILDENPACIITNQPEASCIICFSFYHLMVPAAVKQHWPVHVLASHVASCLFCMQPLFCHDVLGCMMTAEACGCT